MRNGNIILCMTESINHTQQFGVHKHGRNTISCSRGKTDVNLYTREYQQHGMRNVQQSHKSSNHLRSNRYGIFVCFQSLKTLKMLTWTRPCLCVCVCVPHKRFSSETIEDIAIKSGTVTASDMRLHPVRIILTFIQGHNTT